VTLVCNSAYQQRDYGMRCADGRRSMVLAGPAVSLNPHGWPINDTIYADRRANAIYLIYAPRVTKYMLPDSTLSEQTESTETH